MNTTEKYYTPTIEEFNVGFEFEVNNSKDHLFYVCAPEGWLIAGMDHGILGEIGNVQRLITEGQIRVKYLDQSDIESLGWKFIGIGNASQPSQFKNFSLNDYWLEFYFDDDQHIQITGSCDKPNEDHSFGPLHLKNKSELRKFMKQANINHPLPNTEEV